jgi:hypothetical protein
MRKLAKNKKYKINLSGEKGRVEPFSVKDLIKIKYNRSGAVRNTFFCYLISKEPLQFNNGEPLKMDECSSVFNSKNDHHIFPKDILKKNFSKKDIDTVLNICFLTFRENNNIKNTPPWSYLNDFKRTRHFKKVLSSHALPFKDCLLKKENIDKNYESFKRERLIIIKKDLIKMMGKKYIED